MKPNIKIASMADANCSPLMTTEEVSRLLSVSEQTVRNMVRRKELPAVKIGHRVYIQRDKFIAKFCE